MVIGPTPPGERPSVTPSAGQLEDRLSLQIQHNNGEVTAGKSIVKTVSPIPVGNAL